MKKAIILKMVLLIFVGGVLGYVYYYFIGCRTGTCPLSSNPFLTTGYGLLFGFIVGFDSRLFRRKIKQERQ